MKKRLIAITKALAPLILGVVLLWFLLRGYDIKKIYGIISGADFKWAILSLVFGLLANVNRSVRWNMLLQPMGYKPKLVNTFLSVQVGYFYNLVFPRMGEVSRCTMLASYEKVPMDRSLGTVVTERIIDMLSLAGCLLVVMVFEFERVNKALHDFIFDPVMAKVGGLAHKGAMFYIAATLGALALVAFIYLIRRYARNSKILQKIISIMKHFVEGIRSVGRVENVGWFIFHTVLMWVFYACGMYVCFRCFGFTASLSWLTAFVLMTFGTFAYVVPVPSGLGIYPYIIGQVMLTYGINEESGQAFGWVAWCAQFVAIIVVGLLALVLLPVINRAQLVSDESPSVDTK